VLDFSGSAGTKTLPSYWTMTQATSSAKSGWRRQKGFVVSREG
jgi:hypothetical protein